MFQRILVANRGEIALRVIRACKELGVEVVAVYSQADRDAPYLALADRAICIGKAVSSDSYLNIPRLIAAAEVADVQAIHPGYGFLSENPHFAEICRSCNFEFIGPPHEAIRRMGLKTEAKAVAAAAKVPCVPGSDGPVGDDAEALRLARAIGFPVLIKAAAGGGGKGMRVCRDESTLVASLQAARNEAEAAFKNASVYLEKFIDRPRHVEVQILADIARQRRPLLGPRLLAPAPAPEARRGGPRADPPARGPRQARRGRRPAGQGLRLRQRRAPASSSSTPTTTSTSSRSTPGSRSSTPSPRWSPGSTWSSSRSGSPPARRCPSPRPTSRRAGHAFECRINSEDPDHDFRPSPGRITALRIPGGPGVRWDSHAQVGYSVPPNYDSLVGKLIVHAPTRDEAMATDASRRPGRAGPSRGSRRPSPQPDLPPPPTERSIRGSRRPAGRGVRDRAPRPRRTRPDLRCRSPRPATIRAAWRPSRSPLSGRSPRLVE